MNFSAMKNQNNKDHGPVTLAELAAAGFNFGMQAVATVVLIDACVTGGER